MEMKNPNRLYAGRVPGVTPINVSLDKDAAALLRQYAPTAKAHGRFLSRLIFEYAERQRILEKVAGVLEEVHTTGEGE